MGGLTPLSDWFTEGFLNFALKGCFMEGILNILFAIIALPLGLGLLGYGAFYCVKGDADTGIFLILLGLLLAGSVGWGYIVAAAKARRKAARAQSQPLPKPAAKAPPMPPSTSRKRRR